MNAINTDEWTIRLFDDKIGHAPRHTLHAKAHPSSFHSMENEEKIMFILRDCLSLDRFMNASFLKKLSKCIRSLKMIRRLRSLLISLRFVLNLNAVKFSKPFVIIMHS